MGGTALQRNRHSPPLELPSFALQWKADCEHLLELPPIPGPKPWSDDLERAAVAGCIGSCSPRLSLTSIGVPPSTVNAWLSDEPPECYQNACKALAERLKSAQDASERMLLGRIQIAAQDPKHWTAAAWILERSRGYVVKQANEDGPRTVINIGQLNVSQGESPRRIEDAIEGQVIPDRMLKSSSPT